MHTRYTRISSRFHRLFRSEWSYGGESSQIDSGSVPKSPHLVKDQARFPQKLDIVRRQASYGVLWPSVRHHRKYHHTGIILISWLIKKFDVILTFLTLQLWIDRTCLITFGYNETVCSNLTDDRWEKVEIEVQKQVADFKVVDSYLGNAAPILMSLYLGPKSDRVGRKLLMYIPFRYHLL